MAVSKSLTLSEVETIQTDPTASWRFVVDKLNIHCSESLVRYVARLEGLDELTLGVKGKSGILQSMATRQASSR